MRGHLALKNWSGQNRTASYGHGGEASIMSWLSVLLISGHVFLTLTTHAHNGNSGRGPLIIEWKSEVEVGNGSLQWMTLPSHRICPRASINLHVYC